MKRVICLVIAFGFAGIISSNFRDHTSIAAEKSAIIDRVCGMEVSKDKAIKLEHEGKEYYFCNKKCIEAFKKEPKKYLKEAKELLEEKRKEHK